MYYDFDKMITKIIDGEKLEYGFIFGNEDIVFVKVGAGGDVRGYEDKYLKMAMRVHERIGATVICASNPDISHETYDEQQIRLVAPERGFKTCNIYLMGISDGAYQNLYLAKRFSETVKWIGINTSFVSISDLKARLNVLPNVSKFMIYGTKDDDFDEVIPAFSEMCCDNFDLKFIEGADHRFTGMLEEFISLADYV